MRTRQLKVAMVSAAAVLASLALGGSTVAAAPPPSTPTLGLQFDRVALLPGQTGQPLIGFTFSDPTVRTVQGLKVSIDTSALPAGVTIDTSNNALWSCAASGTTLLCTAPSPLTVSWYEGGSLGYLSNYLMLDVAASPTASVAAGSLTITATATGLNTVTASAPWSAAEGVKLVSGPGTPVTGPPGFHYADRYTVTNAGTTTVHGVVLSIDNGGLGYAKHYRNCGYDVDNNANCVFDNDLAPGQTYTISEAMGFLIPLTHEAPFNDATINSWVTPTDLIDRPTATPGQDPPLSLVVKSSGAPAPALTQPGRPQTDQHNANSSGIDVTITGSNVADLAAVGASTRVTGPGATATLQLGVRDNGPAATSLGRSGDPISFVTVTIPSGTTATDVPLVCAPIIAGQPAWNAPAQPGFPVYYCAVFTNLGVRQVFPLSFTIRALIPQAAYVGSITITEYLSSTQETAPIVLKTAPPVQIPNPGGPHLPPGGGGSAAHR